MTLNRRIVLNIVATYGRSLYALVIGFVLRVVDIDGGSGLTAAEMVKYAASDDGKNGQV